MESMFYGCSQLRSLDLSNFKTPKLKILISMFENCTQLQSLNLSNLNTSSVISMENMFYECTQLQSLDLTNFNTPKLKNSQRMFHGCSQIQSIRLSNFESSIITKMNSMFGRCTNLRFLDIQNCKSVTQNISNMFNNVQNLQYINIYNVVSDGYLANAIVNALNTIEKLIVCQKNEIITNNNAIYACCNYNNDNSKCEFQNYMIIKYKEEVQYTSGFQISPRNGIRFIEYEDKFYRNNALLTISANKEIKIYISSDITSLESFFDSSKDPNVEKIISVDLSNLNSSLITNLNNMFKGCTSITYINFSNFDTSNINTMIKIFYECNALESIDLSNFDTSSVTNMESMFYGCSKLQSIILSNFDTSKVENMDSMFYGCRALHSLDLSNFDTSSVINMQYMFYECGELQSIDLSKFNTILVKYMQYMFNGCTKLQALILSSDFVTSKVENMEYMFNGCSQLQSLDLSSFVTPLVKNMANMFSGCSALKSINLLNFNTFQVSNMANMFSGCSSLISVDLSNFGTTNTENMNSMFSKCTALESLNLSNFDTTAVQSMDYMFYNCSSLSILDISNFNLLRATIDQIFFGLINLRYINIYNIKDNNKIVSSTLNTDTSIEKIFYVCQQEKLITNAKSLNCCDFYDNEAHCDFNNFNETNDTDFSKEIIDAYTNIISTLEDKDFKVIQTENMVLQFSTVYEQLTNTSEMVSSIGLGECEDKLKEQEGLNETEELLMIKLDVKNKSTNAIFVQYEIFNPRNFSKVSLDVCQNITIKMTVPVILDQEKLSLISHVEKNGYNALDLSGDFYNDVCTPYTAQNGADMVLSSRKTRIYDTIKDINLCQEGCEIVKFDSETSTAECNCNVKTNEIVTDLSKISFDKSEFFDGFYSTLYNSNFRVLKCIKLLFSSKGIKSNYGFYIMTFLLVSFIAFIIVHLIVGQTRIINIINNIMNSKGISDNNNDIEDKKDEIEKESNRELTLQNNITIPKKKMI